MFTLNKFSLIILTRCNLRCNMCCEYVPHSKPFPDMTVEEARRILAAVFQVADHINTLHLTGGGEPFLHPRLTELVEAAMEYEEQFDVLMLFTNSTVPISPNLLEALVKYRKKVLVQLSLYGQFPERERAAVQLLRNNGIRCKVEKYYGEDQSFGGWVDFGHWESYGRTPEELESVFSGCSVTNVLHGNWRTRDGRVHWCSRSQRGTELGLLPDVPADYVDILDPALTVEEKREKFARIAGARFISACNHCSGDQGTSDQSRRFAAAEQIGGHHERDC